MSKNKISPRQLLFTGIGSFAGIAAIAYLSLNHGMALLVPSFGASAVLLYAAPNVPMAQPKNLLIGHLVSAIAGVTVYQLWGLSWWTLTLAVTSAILLMVLTDSLHPPGGATAFAAVYTHQHYSFIMTPVFIGALILLFVAMVLHRVSGFGKYPATFHKQS